MLSQTKENLKEVLEKMQVLDFVLNTVGNTDKYYAADIEKYYRSASNHKLKLIGEVLRLSGVDLVEAVPAEVLPPTAPTPTVTNS